MARPARAFRSNLSLARRLIQARLRGRPLILSHLITARCNAGCETCLWREHAVSRVDPSGPATQLTTAEPSTTELTTAKVAHLYREAGRAGIAQLIVWGGEPLLRADLPELLNEAAQAGLSPGIITNGWLLPKRWPELRGRVRTLIVSLDDVGPAHDRLRHLPGLFDRLDAFAAHLASDPARPRLLVNTVLSTLNPGVLRRVAPVVKRWGAGLYFCPMETGELMSSGFSPAKAHLALPPEELRQAAVLALELEKAGYPLLATREYLELLRKNPNLHGYRCRAPHATLTVLADGSIRDCLCRDLPLGNVRDLRRDGVTLAGILHQPRYRAMLEQADHCSVCNNPDVIETSWTWQLRPFMLARAVRLAAGRW